MSRNRRDGAPPTDAPGEAWDVKSKRCEAAGCTRGCSFGLRGERKRRWCSAHAPTEAINLKSVKKKK